MWGGLSTKDRVPKGPFFRKAEFEILWGSNIKLGLISVINIFIVDGVVKVIERKKVDSRIEEAINCFLDIARKVAVRLPGTKFPISQPVRRPAKKWYIDRLDKITKAFSDGICALNLANVTWVSALLKKEQQFEQHNIHFTIDSGTFIIKNIKLRVQEFFDMELIDVDSNLIKVKICLSLINIAINQCLFMI